MCAIIEEEWRDIAGYEGLYQVSNLGRVRSLNYNKTRKEQILKPGNHTKGYLRIILHKNGKRKGKLIHRLVAEYFVPNPENLPQVNHKDENKENNRADNLEWCDVKYNLNYGTHNERVRAKLINHKKLSRPVLCVETGIVYPSSKEASRQVGVYHQNIYACCCGKQKTAVGYHWRYAD